MPGRNEVLLSLCGGAFTSYIAEEREKQDGVKTAHSGNGDHRKSLIKGETTRQQLKAEFSVKLLSRTCIEF